MPVKAECGADQDHYGVLCLPPHASSEEVKRAYRSLSKQYHPDKACHLDEAARRESERHMVALNVAYQVLASPRGRREYDLSRAAPVVTAPGRCTASCTPAAAPSPAPAASAGPGAGSAKPRYLYGAKYTQRSRQARRMDPAHYTVHTPATDGTPSVPSSGSTPAPTAPAAAADLHSGEFRLASWLQRQMDIAHEWEQAHCPEPEKGERYQWKRAGEGLLRGVRERRQQRDLLESDDLEQPPAVGAA